MDAWLRTHEVEETTRASYKQYARVHLYPAFGDEPLGKISTRLLEEFYAELRRCSARCDGRPRIEHRTTEPHECRTVKHRRPPGRPPAAGYPPHDCAETGCTVVECQLHVFRPLAAATIRRIHFAVRGVLTAAERWEWITGNPAVRARKPRQPTPPTVAQAARIIHPAWKQDDSWGTLVWLVMVTGLRRAELLALRWSDVDLEAGMMTVRRNYVRVNRQSIEKDTKTHQMRRFALDPAIVDVLTEHRSCVGGRVGPARVVSHDRSRRPRVLKIRLPRRLQDRVSDGAAWCWTVPLSCADTPPGVRRVGHGSRPLPGGKRWERS